MRLSRIAIFVGLALLSGRQAHSQGPTFEWVVSAGSATTFSGGYGIASDAAGNVYVTGRFTGTIDFDPGAGVTNLTSAGALDIFVTKTDAAGNLVWARRMGGTLDDYSYDVFVDEGGSVYVTGAFVGTADFDPGAGTFNLSSAGLFEDIFVLKLDANGNLAWARKMGSADFDFGRSIVVSASGNVITTGSFRGTVDFDPGPGTSFLTSASGNDIFISKLNASGNFVWAKRMGGGSNDIGYAVTLDAAENVFTTGSFRSTADFDPGPGVFNMTEAGNFDIFISRLDGSGNFVWAKQIGGTASETGFGIQLDYAGNVYTTGTFEATADFDPGAGTANLSAVGSNDIFIAKLDASGNYVWAKSMGGANDDEGLSLALDGFGSVYATGAFENATVDFDPGPGTFNLTSAGSADVFIIKLNDSGDFEWARAFEGGGSTAEGINVDAFGSIYTTGLFGGTVDFDPGPGLSNVTAAGSNDNFIHKMRQASTPPTIASFAPANGPVGTSVTITGTNFSPTSGHNTVYFGATRATVTAATTTQLTVTVPIGASWQPITVTVAGLTAFSQKPFVVTFPNGGVIDGCALLTPPQYFTGAINSRGLDVGDLDGDGKVDAVVSSNSTDAIMVFRNSSTPGAIDASTFEAPIQISVGQNPEAVKLSDIDGDGKLDIVVTSATDNIVSIFRNISTSGSLTSGSFAPRVDYATGGSGPWRIVCQDLDLDGRTDLAVANNPGNTIAIFRNIGTTGTIDASTFAPVFTITGSGSLTAFEVADFDVDGKPDFMIGHSIGTQMGIIRNISTPGSLSAASFAPRVDFPAGNWLSYTAVGDLDNDNRPDVVTVSAVSATYSIHKNTSTPGTIDASSFAPQVVFPTLFTEPSEVAISDMDGDGKPDIVLPNYVANAVVLYKNVSSTGVLDATSFSSGIAFSGPGNVSNIHSVDIDGDGRPDVINTHWNGPEIAVFRNTVSATPVITGFSPASGDVSSTVTLTGSFAGLPADNTVYFGATKATVVNATTSQLVVTVPHGTTYAPVSVTSGCKTGYARHPFVAAFPGEGNVAAGSFAPKVDFSTGVSSRPTDAELVDLDRDGLPDVVTINDQNNALSAFRNTSTSGTVSFAARIDLAAGGSSQNLEVGDIDNDGRLDIITVSDGSSQVSVYRNTSSPGTISIQPRVAFASGGGGVGVAVGDIDADGKTDIVAVRASGFISIFRSTSTPGTISFAAGQNFAVGSNPYSVAVADIDGDGLVDIAASNRGSNSITVYRNTSTPGSITLDTPVNLSTGAGSQPHGVAIGDLDSDGKPDIASCNYSNRTVSVFRNNSTPGSIAVGSFDTRVDFTNGATGNPTYLSFADVNGDGKPEIFVGNDNGTLVQVHQNTSTSGSMTAGSFAPKVDFTTGTRPYNIIGGDVDTDGKADLVVANATSNSISILRNVLVVGCVPAAQRNALIALYNATDGANWTNNTNWLNANESTWNGVTTTGCNITEIHLQTNNLVGTIPPEIGDLTELTTLRLSDNQLSGTLPSQLTNLANLEYLFINNNSIGGQLPATMGNLVSLKSIETQFNNFTGDLPASLENCTALSSIHLEGNQHTGNIPAFLGNLTNLFSINLGFNQFEGVIPPELGNLGNLSFLSLAGNDLFGVIPPELGDLDQLGLLDLSRNQFFGDIPPELGNCDNLNSLLLWDNLLSGSIPQELDNLTNLMEINLSQNFLSGTIPGWTALPSLGYVNFSNNQLENDLPSSLGTHLAIEELYLNNNFLTLDIPQEIADLPQLRIIDISNNAFTELRAFTSAQLTDLTVHTNHLDFGDLELNLGVANYSYDPQAPLPPGGHLTFTPGGTLTIPFSTPGSANSYQWYEGTTLIPGATLPTLSRPGMTLGDAGYYTVQVTSSLVTGTTLISRSYVVTSDPCSPGGPNGDRDPSFAPDIGGSDQGANGVELQSDGKIIVLAYGNVHMSTNVDGVFRLNPDGTFDNTFTVFPTGESILVQPDDKILVNNYSGLVRLNSDGTEDAAFNSNAPSFYNAHVSTIALQPDGKILLSVSEDSSPYGLYRLNSDGTIDASFSGPTDLDVSVIRVQPDGKILLGGYFPNGIMRLTPTGAFDIPFNEIGVDGVVFDIAVQPDGKIIAVGGFNYFNGEETRNIVRMDAAGNIDPSFANMGITDLTELSSVVYRVLLQPDGDIILAGTFHEVSGTARPDIVRLDPTGAIVCTFDSQAGTNGTIYDAALQANGHIVITGYFQDYNTAPNSGFDRVLNGVTSLLPPTITAVTPISAEQGASITITGTNFSPVASNNVVYFGAAKAAVSLSTTTQITTTVPVGATFEPVTATVGGLTAFAPKPFIPTFSGGSSINAASFAANVDFATSGFPASINLGDLDLDGKVDMVVSSQNGTNGVLSVYRNTSTPGTITAGSFATPLELIKPSSQRGGMSLADIDGDGRLEIIAVDILNDRVSIYRNISSPGTLNASSFAAPLEINVGSADSPTNVDVQDLDADGLPEIVTADIDRDRITIIRNISTIGTIAFEPRIYINTGIETSDIAIRDLNDDSKPDLVVSNQGGNNVSILQNMTISGSIAPADFGAPVLFAVNSTPTKVAIGDIDGDGSQDILTSSPVLNTISVLRSQITAGTITTGSYASAIHFPMPGPAQGVELGDLSGDGKIDVVAAIGSGTTEVGVLQNSSTPGSISFDAFDGFNAGSGPRETALGDLDGDGRTDIATSNFGGSSASVLRSQGSATITITLQPSDVTICAGGTAVFNAAATGTTNITYQWQFSPDGVVPFVDISDGGGYSNTGTASLSVNTTGTFGAGRYQCRINGDLAAEVITADEGLFINPVPAAPGATGNSGCASTNILLTASGGTPGQYRWYTVSTGGTEITSEFNATYLTPSLTATTTYYVSINNGTCESARTAVTATVLALPASPTVTPASGCAPSSSLTLNAAGGSPGEYRWYTVATGGTALVGETNSAYTTPVLSTSTTYFVSINNTICESPRIAVLAEIRSCTPVITAATTTTPVGSSTSLNIAPLVTVISDPLDISSIKVVVPPQSGATATVVAGVLEVNYSGVSFAGTDRLTIEACDMAGHCAQQEITIEVVGDITVFNAISPNGDGKNDTFIIQYIEALPETKSNKVTIFNRWGTMVYEATDYDNSSRVFKGLSDSGEELPSGTYFYKLTFSNGKETRTGFISLRR